MPKTSYDLVVLAAGMGSRFGGVKQVQAVGPHGEMIIEYSIFDALRAGFGRLVLVIRKDIEADFRAAIGRKLESRMDVSYVFQELSDLPAAAGIDQSTLARTVAARAKPWGTGHAVLAARHAVRGPFAAINADDFYGASGYELLARHFSNSRNARLPGYALVGYPLAQTLSEHGMVSRGICATDAAGRLERITEITNIEGTATGARYVDAQGAAYDLAGTEMVSMNFWGLTPAVFPQLENIFVDFLGRNLGHPKAEFYLPTAVSALNEQGSAEVSLLRSVDSWFGLTYREDLPSAQAAVQRLVAAGKYPSPLWD